MRTVLYGRGIIVGEINIFPGDSWVLGEVVWGAGMEALGFFHRVGGVC